MRTDRSRANRPIRFAASSVVKIVAAFLVAMITTFAGALIYSFKLHPDWRSVPVVNLHGVGRASRSEPYAPVPNRSPDDHRTLMNNQQEIAATGQPSALGKTNPGDSIQRTSPLWPGRRESRGAINSGRAKNGSLHVPAYRAWQSDSERSSAVPRQPAPASLSMQHPLTLVQQRQHGPEPALRESEPQNHSVAVNRSEAAAGPEARGVQTLVPHVGSSVFTVERGTSVEVRLSQTLSSDRNSAGETFQAVLASPLMVDGIAFAEKDSRVVGRIADVRKSSMIGGRAHLTLTLADVTTTGGEIVRIDSTNIERLGAGRGVFNRARRAVVLPAGTVVTFNLTSPLRVSEPANR
jgi:hypothetical protein